MTPQDIKAFRRWKFMQVPTETNGMLAPNCSPDWKTHTLQGLVGQVGAPILKKSSPGRERSIRILAGMYADSETGLYYNGARYYDPGIGRYITADSMSVAEHVALWQTRLGTLNQVPLELNSYVYTANNPLRWIDPTGLDILCGNGYSSTVDPVTNKVTCRLVNPDESPQCSSGDCVTLFKVTNSQCMNQCMLEDTPLPVQAACAPVKNPALNVICEEKGKEMYCTNKCDKEVPDSCPAKK